MFKFIVFAIIAVLMIQVRPNPLKHPDTTFEIVRLEEACVRQGGLCVYPDECSSGSLASLPDLCPAQKHRGIQCCYL